MLQLCKNCGAPLIGSEQRIFLVLEGWHQRRRPFTAASQVPQVCVLTDGSLQRRRTQGGGAIRTYRLSRGGTRRVPCIRVRPMWHGVNSMPGRISLHCCKHSQAARPLCSFGVGRDWSGRSRLRGPVLGRGETTTRRMWRRHSWLRQRLGELLLLLFLLLLELIIARASSCQLLLNGICTITITGAPVAATGTTTDAYSEAGDRAITGIG